MGAFPSRFDQAVDLVLQHEGGFVQHPRDPAGATKFGITRETLCRARGHPVSVGDVRDLTRHEARSIYRRLYWDAVRADELPPVFDLAVFDLAVHSGPPRAARMLQSALAVEADGIVGRLTLRAAREADAAQTIRRLARLRTGLAQAGSRHRAGGSPARFSLTLVTKERLTCSTPKPSSPAAQSGPT